MSAANVRSAVPDYLAAHATILDGAVDALEDATLQFVARSLFELGERRERVGSRYNDPPGNLQHAPELVKIRVQEAVQRALGRVPDSVREIRLATRESDRLAAALGATASRRTVIRHHTAVGDVGSYLVGDPIALTSFADLDGTLYAVLVSDDVVTDGKPGSIALSVVSSDELPILVRGNNHLHLAGKPKGISGQPWHRQWLHDHTLLTIREPHRGHYLSVLATVDGAPVVAGSVKLILTTDIKVAQEAAMAVVIGGGKANV